MPRYFEHPDYQHPIAGLKRSNYVLFKNGEIWEKVDGDDENRHYTDVYTSTQPVEIQLKDADNISDNVKQLNEPLTIIGYTVFLGMLYYVLQSQSWSILDGIIDAQLGVWGLVVGLFLWIVIGTFPRLIYELLKGDLNDAQYILVKFIRRPNSPVEIHQGKGWRKELALVFAYVQSVGVTLALLVYSPESNNTSEFMTLVITILGMNAIAGALLIPFIPFSIMNVIGRFDQKLKKIEQLSLVQFFEKTNQLRDEWEKSEPNNLEQLISGGETHTLEFKETYWTATKGENIGQKDKCLQDVVVKVVAGMLNQDGGKILIGITDDKQVSENLQKDCTHSEKVTDLDKLIDAINRDLQNNLIGVAGTDPTGYYRTSLVEYLQNKIIQIDVEKGPGPVYAYQKNVQKRKRGDSKDPNKIEVNKKFKFRRSGSSTEEPSPETWESHIHTHWAA